MIPGTICKTTSCSAVFKLVKLEMASSGPFTYRVTDQMNDLMTSMMLLWIIQVDLHMYSFQSSLQGAP